MSSGRSKKVIIPKGMVSPDEMTIVEIPSEYFHEPFMVAHHPRVVRDRSSLCEYADLPSKPITYNPTVLRAELFECREEIKNDETQDIRYSAEIQDSHRQRDEIYREDSSGSIADQIDQGIIKQISFIEEEEKEKLVSDLKLLQNARRKLILNTRNLSKTFCNIVNIPNDICGDTNRYIEDE